MGSLWRALTICFLNLTFNVVGIIINRLWLIESGVVELSSIQLSLFFYSSICFVVIGISLQLFYLTGFFGFCYLNITICSLMILVDLFFGMNWVLDPNYFFAGLGNVWEQKLNTPSLQRIQHHMKCCGFRLSSEFPNDICTESRTRSCYGVLTATYASSVRGSGVLCIAHAISSFIIIIFSSFSIKKKPKRSHRHSKRHKKLDNDDRIQLNGINAN